MLMAAVGLAFAGLAMTPARASTTGPAAKSAPDIVCASGYFRITNHYAGHEANGGMTGQGVGNGVLYVDPAGSCWRVIDQIVDTHGYLVKQYRNEGGNCLWRDNGNFISLASCVTGDAAEQFYGITFTQGLGWIMGVEAPWGTFWQLQNCGLSGIIKVVATPSCQYFNFPK